MLKRFTTSRVMLTLVGLAAAVSLSGCIVEPVGYDGGVYASYAPPAPRAELDIGVAPGPGYFWSGGYWGWYGGRYVWRPGHWMARRPGYRWERPHWERGERGWRFDDGRWRR